MHKRTRLRAVGWTVMSALSILGSLILQGCGESDPSPYAELDAKYPEGRPGIAGVTERTQDAEYMAKLTGGTKEISALQTVAAAACKDAEHFKGQIVKMLTERLGETPPADVIAAELKKNDHYQVLLKKAEAARAAVTARVAANRELIRERMWADAAAYDALRAEADAKAQAAGLPVRDAATASAPSAPAAEKSLSETAGAPARAAGK